MSRLLAERGNDHALMGFVNMLDQVAGKVHAEAFPPAALQHPPDRTYKALVGTADHELDLSEAAFFPHPDEVSTEPFTPAVALREAQKPAAAFGVDSFSDDDGPGAHLHRSAQAPVHVGGM